MWKFFISHASEDKEAVVQPLAQELEKRGYQVWYDKFTLRIGDSLRESIDKGLRESRYGIIILSPDFFHKPWPKAELNGFFARQMRTDTKVILPVWHNVTPDEVGEFSWMLEDRLGVSTSLGIEKVVDEILLAAGETDTQETPRSEFVDIIQTCATANVRKYAECAFEMKLNSFTGYPLSELYPKYIENLMHMDSAGSDLTLPVVFHSSLRKPSSTKKSILFESEDYCKPYSNWFCFDKIELHSNVLRYSMIELAEVAQMPGVMRMTISNPIVNILYLLLLMERMHRAEKKRIDIDIEFAMYAPQKTQPSSDGAMTPIELIINTTYFLGEEASHLHLHLSDLDKSTIYRVINQIYGLFQSESMHADSPFLRLSEEKFAQDWNWLMKTLK